MVVKGLERNMSSLYEARRLLLGLDSCEIAKVTQPTPDPTNGLTHYWLSMLLQQLRLAEQGDCPQPTCGFHWLCALPIWGLKSHI